MNEAFHFRGGKNILRPEHMAIMNGWATAGVNQNRALSVNGLWAPPYYSEDFALDVRLNGQEAKADDFCWYPYGIEREGRAGNLHVHSLTALCAGMSAFVMRVSLTGNPGEAVCAQILTQGSVGRQDFWGFGRQKAAQNEGCEIALRSSQTELTLDENGKALFWLAAAIGEKGQAQTEADSIRADWEGAVQAQFAAYDRAVTDLFERLPSFSCENPALNAFYKRSLVHYITNRWDIPEFHLRPTYCTGGARGGCFGAYLWDYAAGWELHPLFDPAATRAHIAHYLSIDMERHYAFNPVDGKPFGPWYPVNSEKIVGLIRYYALHTGDTEFLRESINGKPVWRHAVAQAALLDDPTKPAALIDYGIEGEHHLELRRGFPYCGVMPDLNARRYQTYQWAADIAQLAGQPQPFLRRRAEEIKVLMRRLWDDEKRWFAFEHGGKRDFRWTVQMYKFIDSAVLDEEQKAGLLSHLNEDEFYSAYGLHSLSKRDEAYDQADIDNGGGGACTLFPTQIAEKLYRAGHPDEASDMLRRVLWWGERVPYWGDSFVANYMDYRQDTPLQCAIGGVTGAQAIIFGMFGIQVRLDGAILFNPRPPAWAGRIELRNLRLRGHVIDFSS